MTAPPAEVPAAAPPRQPRSGRPRPGAPALLFAAGLALYAATRLYGLVEFPVFFFCDEATQANVADRLVHHGFRDEEGVFLPPYFLNDQRWAMSLNVYLLAAPVVAFGKSILLVRGTFVAVALFGAAALGLALRTAGIGVWWAAPYLLAVLPVDFLHSRMALETTPAFYAGFLWAYLLYRLRSPRDLFLALVLGAATFYSYTAGQGIMLVTGLLLLAIDAPFHLRQRLRLGVAAALLLALLALPFLREQRRHPGTTREQLLVLHSYWIVPSPLSQKLATFWSNYREGFDPGYWFVPNGAELIRHRMDEMAYVPVFFAPLLAIGALACLARWRRSPGHRVILLSPLAVPFAAALADRQILRALPMIVPIVLLSAAGLEEIFRVMRRLVPERVLAVAVAASLTVLGGRLTVLSLTRGGLWFREYGLYGLQFGARQIFDGIRVELARSPGTRIHLASSWANNPNQFLDFFLTSRERPRAQMGDIDPYLTYWRALSENDLFVMTAGEYDRARRDPKVAVERPARTVLYPDGTPGFYFARIRYTPQAPAIFAAERQARRRLQEETSSIGGQPVIVRHSMSDMGSARDLLDGRFETVFRGLEANPFVMEFLFPSQRTISRIDLSLSRMNCEIAIEVSPARGGEPIVLRRTLQEPPGDSTQEFPLPAGPVRTSKVRITVRETDLGEPAHIEIRDVAFREAAH